MEAIIAPTRATDLIMVAMVAVRIMAEALWWSPSGIGRTIVAPDIGRATGITPGSLDIGCGGMARKFGSGAIMSCGDIDRTAFGAVIP